MIPPNPTEYAEIVDFGILKPVIGGDATGILPNFGLKEKLVELHLWALMAMTGVENINLTYTRVLRI